MNTPLWPLIAITLDVALRATLLTTPFAIATGLWLARATGWRRAVVQTLANLPLVLPPVATGLLLLVCLGPRSPLGVLLQGMGIELAFQRAGAIMASATVSFPLYVRAVRLRAEAMDPGLVDAAQLLGASTLRAFRTITLPLLSPGILAGASLAFARSLGEFGATIVIAGNLPGISQTLPLAIWSALQQPGGTQAALWLSLAAVMLSAIVLFGSERLVRRNAWS